MVCHLSLMTWRSCGWKAAFSLFWMARSTAPLDRCDGEVDSEVDSVDCEDCEDRGDREDRVDRVDMTRGHTAADNDEEARTASIEKTDNICGTRQPSERAVESDGRQ